MLEWALAHHSEANWLLGHGVSYPIAHSLLRCTRPTSPDRFLFNPTLRILGSFQVGQPVCHTSSTSLGLRLVLIKKLQIILCNRHIQVSNLKIPDSSSFNLSLSEFDDWQFGVSSAKPSWFLHGNAGTRSSCLYSLLVLALEVLG